MKNNKLLLSFESVLVCVVVSVLMFGCVSEQISGKEKKGPDKAKAIELHVQMALGYVEKGNRESARHHLTKAFEIDGDSAPATNAMAMLYQLEGEQALAEENFKLALKRDKNLTIAHNNYGVFLYNQKRYQEAFTQFELAAADLANLSRSQALTNVGRAALKIGNDVRAKAAFEHACILDRKNAEAYIELADINFQNQEYADAKRNLDVYEALAGGSSRSLMLGIRLEKVFGNRDKEAVLAIKLKNNFPYSKELLEYQQKNGN
ncbi:MAG: type IV pilus biogenesis/stability protein PilW [Gammaproteobacteria bacterium]|nr:MAG: type IV pilus biogenesis/stability protein PilW [Gammaproteobacteria bacterium]